MQINDQQLAKNLRRIFSAIVAGVLIFGLFYWNYQRDISLPVDPEDDTVISFQIKKGENAKEISKNLEKEGLIRSDFAFRKYLKSNDLDETILAGRFLLNKTMTIKDIVTILADPSQAESIITIQEGLMIRDIDEKLVDLGLIEPGEFLDEAKNFNGWEFYNFLDKETLSKLDLPIEGYIYPDTYYLDTSEFQPHDLIYLAMDNFERKTADLLPEIKRHTIHEIITMASIIENEVFGSEDRKIVSGILWKRLENGWPLGADATLLYITNDRTIDASDLNLDSPYNTRKFGGLPPGPISNPSIESIEAAMYPTSSDYWFYLTTLDTGEVIYARTNEEQNMNRSKYL